MIRALKIVNLAVMAAGVCGILYLSGISSAILTCAPFLVFAGAIFLGRYLASGICTFVTLGAALAFGTHTYYQAFRIHQHGEADAIALIVVPIVQTVLATTALLVAFGEWFFWRKKYKNVLA